MSTSDHSPIVKAMLASPTLNRNEEYELAVRMRKGDKQARKRLIEGNLCYAVRFATCSKHYGVPIDELISEAMTGLTKAVDRYEPERGTRFITYAAHWMRAFMTIYLIRNWRMVNPAKGEKQSKMFFRLRKEMSLNLTKTGDFETSMDIVSSAFAVDRERAKSMLQLLTTQDASLDATICDVDAAGSETTLYERIPNKDPGVEEIVSRKSEMDAAKEKVGKMMAMLSARERQILQLRHLRDKEDALTLDDLGKLFGVSRERIRQIEKRLFGKLQRHMRGEPMTLPRKSTKAKRPAEPYVKPLIPRARSKGSPRPLSLCQQVA